MKGNPMKRNFGIVSPMKKDEVTKNENKEELNEFGETPEEYKQRMIRMGLRKSDIQEEIDSKENKKVSKKDKETN